METFIQKVINEYDNACEEKEAAWDESYSAPTSLVAKMKDASITCPVCGKRFLPAPLHSYKHYKTKAKVCTYSCSLRSEREYLNGSSVRQLTLRERIELEEAAEKAREENELAKQRAAIDALNRRSVRRSPKKGVPTRTRKQRPFHLEALNA